ncbi:ABC transporter substrate-binding protein [Flexivirga meconopsidis]|uniref:ABC transporter substrate-binding protein n=1 Tax=Flexivirga meconopsidis TaxID=2977121 RepID=UPI0022402DDB|nr:sugar ABC transporter substrate-binding protein [Flexivirga meconopsidis]
MTTPATGQQSTSPRPVLTRRALLGAGLGLGAAAALSACGSDDPNDLSFWNFYGPSPTPSTTSDWFKSVTDEWNRNNDVKVRPRFIAGSAYLNGNTLQTAFSAGSGPDIFLISPGDFLRYQNGGALLDLTPYLPEGAREDYVKGALDTRTVDGKVYALPMEIEPLVVYYDKRAFEQAHLAESDLPRTWDQFLDVGTKLTNRNRFGALFETLPGYYQNFVWYPFLWQGGGGAVADGKSIFDSEAARGALGFWRETQRRGIAPKAALGGGSGDTPSNLAVGYCAMQQSGIWAVADLKTQVPKFEYGIFPLPIPEGGKQVTDGGGWAFAVNARGKNPEAAARFVSWALASTDAAGIDRARRWNTVAKTNLPPRTSVRKAAEAKGDFTSGVLKTFATSIAPTLRSEPRYPPEVYKAISDAIQSTQLSGNAPAGAARQASDVIDNFLLTYRGGSIL